MENGKSGLEPTPSSSVHALGASSGSAQSGSASLMQLISTTMFRNK